MSKVKTKRLRVSCVSFNTRGNQENVHVVCGGKY